VHAVGKVALAELCGVRGAAISSIPYRLYE